MATVTVAQRKSAAERGKLVEMVWDPITRIVGSLGLYTRIDFEKKEVAECFSTSSVFRGYSIFMLRYSLVGTHVLVAVENGRFESLIEPTETARMFVAQCRNLHTWPVLVGDRTRQNVMLSSPIVLYDFPSVAKESRGDLCDAAEIDEILTLRILTMTEAEKQEARRTDPRAREILDSVDAIAPSDLAALHGTLRSADFFNPPGTPSPEDATIDIGGCRIARGSHGDGLLAPLGRCGGRGRLSPGEYAWRPDLCASRFLRQLCD